MNESYRKSTIFDGEGNSFLQDQGKHYKQIMGYTLIRHDTWLESHVTGIFMEN